ncbi:response regulator [Erwinia sp. E602]|uniref:response regulator n=1 Tax=Erwinia sp. E602 TaxID=2675378 RepID=UPI001BA81D5D|nr:response regulator [Erwinia sp. E602]QUG76752.1 response regulator [Erwinia sp. E602]
MSEALDVLIVEDEPLLARLHAEFIEQHFNLRVVATAATLAEAKRLAALHQPRLILLDNFLPDGQGIELMESAAVKAASCSVVFITAASDMHTCSQAIRNGAFDYIIKPLSYKRLRNSLERFMQFVQTQHSYRVIDQHSVDALYNLQSKQFAAEPAAKGIEANTLALVQQLFEQQPDVAHTVEEVVEQAGISKTTARRYLEHCVASDWVQVEMLYGNIGHPRRLYRKKTKVK